MPVQYGSIIDEHRTVRERVGLFDLSHMGELYVEGPRPAPALAAALVVGPAEPGHRARPLLDDLRARRRDHRRPDRVPPRPRTRFLVVANAGNAAIVSDALAERLEGFKAVLDDRSLATGLLAVQGPRAREVLAPLTDVDLGGPALLRRRRGDRRRHPGARRADRLHRRGRVRGLRRHRRGPAASGTRCSPAVRAADGVPIGLGARDTLRLEAGMPLYGNELDLDTNPYDAGLGRVVKLGKPGDFVGRAALERVAARRAGASAWSASIVEGRGIARHGYPVVVRRPADRRRHQRDPVADARRADRDGVRRTRATPSRVPLSTSRSATRGSRHGSSPCRSTGGIA